MFSFRFVALVIFLYLLGYVVVIGAVRYIVLASGLFWPVVLGGVVVLLAWHCLLHVWVRSYQKRPTYLDWMDPRDYH